MKLKLNVHRGSYMVFNGPGVNHQTLTIAGDWAFRRLLNDNGIEVYDSGITTIVTDYKPHRHHLVLTLNEANSYGDVVYNYDRELREYTKIHFCTSGFRLAFGRNKPKKLYIQVRKDK